MQHSYDDKADALYITLSDEDLEKSVVIDEEITVDIGYSGKVVGIEVLGASEGFRLSDLVERFGLQEHRHSFKALEDNPPGRVAFA